MRVHWLVVLAALFVSAFAPLAREAHAEAPFARFVGRYRARDLEGQRLALEAAIERTVAQMNIIARPIARRRLRQTTPPVKSLAFAYQADRFYIHLDAFRYAAFVDGRPGQGRDADDNDIQIAFKLDADTLVARFYNEDGEKRSRFSFDASGQVLEMDVVIASPKLPSRIQYRASFSRE